MDLYAHPSGGHTQIQIAMDCRIEAAQIITPLDDGPVQIQMIEPTGLVEYNTDDGDVYPAITASAISSFRAVGEPIVLPPYTKFCMEAQGEIMLTAIARASDGHSYGFTHSDYILYGQHAKWTDLARASDSGIKGLCRACNFDCRIQHVHFFGWIGHGPMPPGAGTHPAHTLLAQLGWKLEEVFPECMGPPHYQACQAIAGRRR